MAVTLTLAELRAALRLSDSPEETAEVTRLLAYCTEAVEKHVPTAPDTIHNEAVRRLCGYLFDMPEAASVVTHTPMRYAIPGRPGCSCRTGCIASRIRGHACLRLIP